MRSAKTTPSSRKRSALKPETTFGEDVVHSLADFFDTVDRGGAISVRTVRLELQPGEYTGACVRAARDKLNVSQAVFAQLLAVKVKTVQSWEQGGRPPTGPVRRLLDDMNQNPRRWLDMLRAGMRAKSVASA